MGRARWNDKKKRQPLGKRALTQLGRFGPRITSDMHACALPAKTDIFGGVTEAKIQAVHAILSGGGPRPGIDGKKLLGWVEALMSDSASGPAVKEALGRFAKRGTSTKSFEKLEKVIRKVGLVEAKAKARFAYPKEGVRVALNQPARLVMGLENRHCLGNEEGDSAQHGLAVEMKGCIDYYHYLTAEDREDGEDKGYSERKGRGNKPCKKWSGEDRKWVKSLHDRYEKVTQPTGRPEDNVELDWAVLGAKRHLEGLLEEIVSFRRGKGGVEKQFRGFEEWKTRLAAHPDFREARRLSALWERVDDLYWSSQLQDVKAQSALLKGTVFLYLYGESDSAVAVYPNNMAQLRTRQSLEKGAAKEITRRAVETGLVKRDRDGRLTVAGWPIDFGELDPVYVLLSPDRVRLVQIPFAQKYGSEKQVADLQALGRQLTTLRNELAASYRKVKGTAKDQENLQDKIDRLHERARAEVAPWVLSDEVESLEIDLPKGSQSDRRRHRAEDRPTKAERKERRRRKGRRPSPEQEGRKAKGRERTRKKTKARKELRVEGRSFNNPAPARWNPKKKRKHQQAYAAARAVSGWDFVIEADGKVIGRGSGYPDREKVVQGATIAFRDQGQRGRWGWQIVELDDIYFPDRILMPNNIGIQGLPGNGSIFDYTSRPMVVITIQSPRTRELMPEHKRLKARLQQAYSEAGDIAAVSEVERAVGDGEYRNREIAIQAYGIRPHIARLGWSERGAYAERLRAEIPSLADQIYALERTPA